MNNLLYELDEQAILCRDPISKKYLVEAISCYKTGAFRSAIVTIWIAIVFDLINKTRELSIAGDKAAEEIINKFDDLREKNDISSSLKFERDILSLAKERLEIISHIEYIDLERIQQDRNRCAHPSMLNDNDIFSPSGELVRNHIVVAVQYLLRYPPAQGKAALSKILSEIDSDYFPEKPEEIKTTLNKTPLFRARETLIKSVIIVLIKNTLKDEKNIKYNNKIKNVLLFIQEQHYKLYSSTLNDKISDITRHLPKPENSYIKILKFIPNSWGFLEDDLKLKFKNYIKDIPSENISELDEFINFKFLKDESIYRINRITRKESIVHRFFLPNEIILNKLIDIYIKSRDFAEANEFYPVVEDHIGLYSIEQLRTLLKGSLSNSQVYNSNKFPILLRSLYNSGFENYKDTIKACLGEEGRLDILPIAFEKG
ncbi:MULTISPECIES: hypothetical protein [Klebsiella]|uniref:hypothetical protein n=1 Tax=Klebsiella pneumoniae complex TaxID=3390273 RepID=UPI000CEB870A|nr:MULTISPECIES: hypothetical protein [Klebsiella]HBQ8604347.1 hypothetical protein [Klebsiella pneumoniae]MCS6647506.1 hypothetical protein [Klebsiella pneumoniae subsp. pneumoniae]MEB5914881.1 hypothetical protein [Klebsiella quasipneumoniae]ROG08629.1 hypothetical protein C4Y63_019865 [Klebsiella pneumoniae subsp. pneumoniae]GKQ00712.1 hypothetical protein NUKP74_44140 [Klebsiella quasipneumoniae]